MNTERKKSGTLWAVERKAIMEALAKADGHRQRTAEILGIGERTLYRRLREHGFYHPYAKQGRPPKKPRFSLIRAFTSFIVGLYQTAGNWNSKDSGDLK